MLLMPYDISSLFRFHFLYRSHASILRHFRHASYWAPHYAITLTCFSLRQLHWSDADWYAIITPSFIDYAIIDYCHYCCWYLLLFSQLFSLILLMILIFRAAFHIFAAATIYLLILLMLSSTALDYFHCRQMIFAGHFLASFTPSVSWHFLLRFSLLFFDIRNSWLLYSYFGFLRRQLRRFSFFDAFFAMPLQPLSRRRTAFRHMIIYWSAFLLSYFRLSFLLITPFIFITIFHWYHCFADIFAILLRFH